MSIYEKRTIHIIILEWGGIKAFPLRSTTRQGCSLFALLSSMECEVLARTIRLEKNNKSIQIKKEVKLSLSLDGIIILFRKV